VLTTILIQKILPANNRLCMLLDLREMREIVLQEQHRIAIGDEVWRTQ